jgi:hypothetical protein
MLVDYQMMLYICCIEKNKDMNMKERLQNLMLLAQFMFENHKEELFVNDYEEYLDMCEDVIRHEAEEQYDMTLEEVEVYYVKNMTMDLYTELSLNNNVR